MAEARRGKQKRKQALKDVLEKPTKEEYAVAKFLRFHKILNKDGKFLDNNVQYFIGSKAVDILMESKWSAKNSKSNALFTSRSTCEHYCERLLEKGFFHRVQKFDKRDKKKRLKDAAEKKATKDETSKKSEKKSKKEKDETEGEKEKDKDAAEEKVGKEKSTATEEKVDKPKDEPSAEEKKRRKKKARFEMHEMQLFIDGPELYVWIYDPVPAKTFIIGLLLVFGSIAVCLFPLWPPEVRLGVYYLSIAAACFVGLILGLCIVRVIIFALVWGLTMGKVSFWLLPNLTEDVGFFESFRPIYQCDINSKAPKPSNEASTSTSPVVEADMPNPEGDDGATRGELENVEELGAKDEEAAEEEELGEMDEEVEEEDEEDDAVLGNDVEDDVGGKLTGDGSENEEEGRKSGSSSNDNGYEMVEAEDAEIVSEDVRPTIRQRRGKKKGDKPRLT